MMNYIDSFLNIEQDFHSEMNPSWLRNISILYILIQFGKILLKIFHFHTNKIYWSASFFRKLFSIDRCLMLIA
jgi:hypothetical protein